MIRFCQLTKSKSLDYCRLSLKINEGRPSGTRVRTTSYKKRVSSPTTQSCVQVCTMRIRIGMTERIGRCSTRAWSHSNRTTTVSARSPRTRTCPWQVCRARVSFRTIQSNLYQGPFAMACLPLTKSLRRKRRRALYRSATTQARDRAPSNQNLLSQPVEASLLVELPVATTITSQTSQT